MPIGLFLIGLFHLRVADARVWRDISRLRVAANCGYSRLERRGSNEGRRQTTLCVPHVSEMEPVGNVDLPHVSEIGARATELA